MKKAIIGLVLVVTLGIGGFIGYHHFKGSDSLNPQELAIHEKTVEMIELVRKIKDDQGMDLVTYDFSDDLGDFTFIEKPDSNGYFTITDGTLVVEFGVNGHKKIN